MPPKRPEEQVLDLKRIRERRQELGLTMEAAAERADMSSKGHWSDIENGTKTAITVGTFVKMARALKLPPAELLLK